MPDLSLESRYQGHIAGVDEAGRGPWAGPVVAACVSWKCDVIPEGINDSKALSAARREAMYEMIERDAYVGVGRASVEEIDQMNILQATFLAMKRAVETMPMVPDMVLVDGNQLPDISCPAETVIKGDAKSLSIAAASIIAKVTRDREMLALHQHYPEYGWDSNAGYGTKQHIEAIDVHGITEHHRKSFAPIRKRLEGMVA